MESVLNSVDCDVDGFHIALRPPGIDDATMNVRLLGGWILASLGLQFQSVAREVVFSQPAGSVTNYFMWASNYGSNTPASDFNYRAYDNFRITRAALLTNVRWTGVIHDLAKPTNNPPRLAGTETWRIAIYADEEGLPGSLLLEQRASQAAVQSSLFANSVFRNYPVAIREWSLALTSPLRLPAERQYWISIQLLTAAITPQFSWYYSGQNGDGFYQFSYQTRGLSPGKSNLAFGLDGTVAGGPAPWLRVFPNVSGITVQWPDPDRAYELETSLELGPGKAWQRLVAVSVGATGERAVTIPQSALRGQEFFRLIPAP